jgi:hypothetical protein
MKTQAEQATDTMREQQSAERSLAEKYARVFGTKEGQEVLSDLLTLYPCDRPRFEAKSTRANPVAALMGGIHFDGSAAVTSYITTQIAAAKKQPEPLPTVVAP